MRLTQWTDYTLRVLMYCAVRQGREAPVTITEIAQVHGISRSHLTKIVQTLGAQGLLETTRGRGGGIRLLQPAGKIIIGDVIRATETDFHLVECFDPGLNECRLDPACVLKGVLGRALHEYFKVLDDVTLADIVARPAAAGAELGVVQWVEAGVGKAGAGRSAPAARERPPVAKAIARQRAPVSGRTKAPRRAA